MSEEQKKVHIHLQFKSFLIIFAVLLVIISTAVVGISSYISARQTMMEAINNNAKNSIDILNQNINQTIQEKEYQLNRLAKAVNDSNISDPETRFLFSNQYNTTKMADNISVSDIHGRFLSGNGEKMAKDYDPRLRSWYKLAMAHPGKIMITEPYISASTNHFVFALVKTTADKKCVVNLTLNVDALQKTVQKIKIGTSGFAALYTGKNIAISSRLIKIGHKVNDPHFSNLVNKKYSGSYFTIENGLPRQVVFIHNQLTGWSMIGNISQTEISSDLHGILYQTIIICVIMILLGLVLSLLAIRGFIRPLKKLIQIASHVVDKDLTHKVQDGLFTEFNHVGQGFNQMIDELREVLNTVNNKAQSLAASSEELTASTEESKATIDEIAQSVQQMAAGADDSYQATNQVKNSSETIQQQINHLNKNTNELATVSGNAMEKVKNGKSSLIRTTDQIKSIDSNQKDVLKTVTEFITQIKNIDEMNNLINGIAEETHLLSLNAAIEAARAGENGRGFSVVAEEIRKLADQSAVSSKKITQVVHNLQDNAKKMTKIIDSSTSEIKKGLDAVENTGDTFRVIDQSMKNVTGEVTTMTQTVKTISGAVDHVNESMKRITKQASETSAGAQSVSAATEEQSAAMEEVSTNAGTLSEMAEALHQIIDNFKLS